MTTCQWNPKYDRPSLGGEGDCDGEAAWEVGDKHVLRLCHDCACSRSFDRFSKRPIFDPIEAELENIYEVTIVTQAESTFVVKAATATRAVNLAMRNEFDDVKDARILHKSLLRVEEKDNA